jgi:hypothetical protein
MTKRVVSRLQPAEMRFVKPVTGMTRLAVVGNEYFRDKQGLYITVLNHVVVKFHNGCGTTHKEFPSVDFTTSLLVSL